MSHVIRTLAAAALCAVLFIPAGSAQADPLPCTPETCTQGEAPMAPPHCDSAVFWPMHDEIVRLNGVVRSQERRVQRLERTLARKNLTIQGLRDQLSR